MPLRGILMARVHDLAIALSALVKDPTLILRVLEDERLCSVKNKGVVLGECALARGSNSEPILGSACVPEHESLGINACKHSNKQFIIICKRNNG